VHNAHEILKRRAVYIYIYIYIYYVTKASLFCIYFIYECSPSFPHFQSAYRADKYFILTAQWRLPAVARRRSSAGLFCWFSLLSYLFTYCDNRILASCSRLAHCVCRRRLIAAFRALPWRRYAFYTVQE